MAEQRSRGGLKWVRDELLANLERIGAQMRADGDIGEAVTLLFEMRAVLMALPLPAAAMLAEEMQRTCEQIIKEDAADAPQARESVSLALVQLDEHLRRSDSGEHQEPLALLASINDLRHSRGVPPMSSAELLIPSSVLAQSEQVAPDSLAALVRLALKVRPHFHRYLVRWFNGDNAHEGLLGLSRLFNHMRRYFKQGPVHELFLAAEAVVDGLLDGQLDADAPTKALIGRLDKLLKPLTATVPEWPADLAQALIGDLLARIGKMPPGAPAVQELERIYGRSLTDEPHPDSISQSNDNDTAPMLDALRRELDDIAAPLLRTAGGRPDPIAAGAMPRRLSRLAESLSALNQEAAAGRIRRCVEALEIEGHTGFADAGRLGDVLRTLRQVDAELAACAELAAPPPASTAQRAAPRARDTVAATLREVRVALACARTAIGSGPMSPAQSIQLADAYRSLQGLAGTLRGIGEMEPARLLDGLATQLRIRYLDPGQVPGEAGVELIGRALAAVDIHLEDRLERDLTDVRMIAEADYAIERLSGLLRPDEDVDGDSEATDSLPWSEASQSVNLEFLNLFLDEAQDELESIRVQHERWSRDRHDDVALSIMRRSFQTLKNSGSLVGARHLADLARNTAAVLERLLDGELPADLAAADFLADVVAMLPEIIDAESQRRKAPTANLIHAAKALLAIGREPRGSGGKVIQLPLRAGAPAAEPDAGDAGRRTEPGAAAATAPTASPPGDDAPPAPAVAHARDAARDAAPAATDEGLEALLAGDDLLEVFADEADELINALDAQLRDWRGQGLDADGVASARRRLHTLKGSARMAGVAPVGDLSHALESLLTGAEALPAAMTGPLTALLQRALDTLSAQVTAARQRAPLVLPDGLLDEIAAAAPAVTQQLREEAPHAVTPAGPGAEPAAAPDTETTTARDDPAMQLRVGADWLDGIINRSGEVGAFRARLVQQNARLGFRLAQLEDGLRRAARRVDTLAERDQESSPTDADADAEPPEAEALRTLREAAALLGESRTLAAAIGELQDDNAELLRLEMRLAEAMQDELLQARMLPFGRVEARLARLVRLTAEGTGKQVELSMQGTDVALDRNVLERFLPPLEHLLRNAVVHGIEAAQARQAHGKPAAGRLRVQVAREGNDVVFEVTDDGAGMDPVKLRERAVAQGLVAADAELSHAEILSLVLRPGFSTAAEVTLDAGRGVGLDVVNTQVASLNGELELSSKQGHGTRFRVRLPLTLSIVEALLVSAADTLLAVPHGTALAVARVAREQLVAGDAVVEYRGERFPVEPIERALNPAAAPSPPQQRWLPVLLVAAGAERVAFQVDALLDTQRVMVKPIGPSLAALRWLSGGTVLPDGRVALLADLPALLRAMRQQQAAEAPAERRPVVLVVDDSATVRRVAQRLLARENMEVIGARDGVEAQVMLRRRQPDLLLVDLDMPRMNGLELTRWVRGSDELRRLPVIMITSMAGDAERAEALSAGVDRFVAKPFAEDELLAQIESLLMVGISA
ncbi:MAG: response regulator [Thiohalocapsa sp.]|jgi:chemosensory pili system protein ChpA (sensor histidine kinase/response regulator)|uniref:hybrid sensor histidine kinase/response regulator n=1 Tax=Thiohalocapsa sp. TaxID=2497641 RepID=UPI0025FA99B2|nr:response regulator [Thiohalocapsa sp.]MCG6940908.1 response regulator [Thiohalocapsa sp.]